MKCCGKPNSWLLGVGAAQLATIFLSTAVFLTFKLGSASSPFLEIAGSFGILAIVHGIAGLFSRNGDDRARRTRWATFMGIALLQLAGMAATLIGLKYSCPGSWILMMQLDVVIILPLTASFFKVNYRAWHYSGFACAGMGLIVLSIFGGASSEGALQNSAMGNMLVGIGAVVLGITNVWIEGALRGGAPRHDLLGGVGIFGLIFGFTASLLAEEITTHDIQENVLDVTFLRMGVAVALFLLQGVTSVSLPYAGAVYQKTSSFTSSLCIQGGFLLLGGGSIFLVASLPGVMVGVSLLVMGGLVYVLGGDPYVVSRTEAEEKLIVCIVEDTDESAAPLL